MQSLDQLLKSTTHQNKRNPSKNNFGLFRRIILISDDVLTWFVCIFSRKPTKKAKPGDPIPLKNERPKKPEHGPGIWCVIPLLAKLPGSVQARIIKVAGQLMEKMNFFNVYRHVEEEDESDEDSDEEQDEEDSDEDDENENKR